MVEERREATRLETRVAEALTRVIDPELRRPITELGMVGSVTADDDTVIIPLKLTIVGCPAADRIERDVRQAAVDAGALAVQVDVSVMSPAERDALTARLRGGRPRQFGPDSLTRVLAVTSGKGGVGKSTITANLAVALAQRGLTVGVLDADVFGFSIPGLLGIAGAKPTKVGDMILPPVAEFPGVAVKAISIGMFVEDGAAVSWRGPMLHRTMQQFVTDVFWGDLDVLLLDLPPGTGDVAISLGQLLPQAEVLVVTTPQAAAAEVAERSAVVARQTGQTVIGVVETMTGELFGAGGGATAAERLGVPLLASVPLSVAVREGGDRGVPVVLADPADPAAIALDALAASLATRERGLAGRALPFTTP